jgi:hypothetical protein
MHRSIFRAVVTVAIAALVVPRLAPAQGAATRTLGKPSAQYSEPFSGIGDVRELSDGRVLVLDIKDKLLYLVAKDLASAKAVGREGSGPKEYRTPTQFVRGLADTTMVNDVMNARFLVIDPAGEAVSTLPMRELGAGLPVGPAMVRGFDPQGRLLYQGLNFRMTPAGPAFGDTTAILRWDFKAKKPDTLGYIRTGAPSMKMSGDVQKGGGSVRMGLPPFGTVDEWVLLADGRVAIVRGLDYHVDVVMPDRRIVSGPPIPWTKVKVTSADKDKLHEANQKAQVEMQKAVASAASTLGARAQSAKMPSMQIDDPTEWPEYKPPFPQGGVRASPSGMLWVQRYLPASDETTRYDVIDPAGKLQFSVQLPVKHRMVGIGASSLYVVRIDDDDLQYLERYPLPR